MNKTTKSILQFTLFLFLGLLILYLSYRNFSNDYLEDCALKGIPEQECSLLEKLVDDFKTANFLWIVIIIALFMVSNIFRALRWKQLLDPLGYSPRFFNLLGATMVGYLANLGLPRMGEIIKPGILTKYEQIPIEKGIGTIVIDRILDVLSLLVVIAIAFVLSFPTFQSYFEANFNVERAQSLQVLGVLAFVGVIGIIVFNRIINNSNLKHPFLKKIQTLWSGFYAGLLSVRNVKNKPLLVVYSIAIWMMYYLMTYLCFFAYAPTAHLGLVAGLVVFVFGTLGIVFPSPGGMGSYHVLVTQALIIFGLNEVEAFSFSNIIFFAIQIFGNIVFGLIFLILLPIFNKND
ncbi:MAG: flippase-like domain-containing protein [Saprospiraceae bacterium]|nr:flippase-like domain-containing protein [Saprospiraceae bacterium]